MGDSLQRAAGADAECVVRVATLEDLEPLAAMEERCFETDRISRRQFRYMLTRANAATFVCTRRGALLGYVLILFSHGTSMARLYSIAVAQEARRLGVGRILVETAEHAARENDRAYLRLEVRKDNPASIALFHSLGYKQFGEYADYYEDHADALRLEKSLAPDLLPELARVPYYEQTLDFTCGPSALMMAMKALDPELVLTRKLELRIWRESTTIFMTAGHGGCGPHGLALAAVRRGFQVELHISDPGTVLVDSVRSAEKREVMRLVQEDLEEELARFDVPIVHGAPGMEGIQDRFEAGAIPLVLISSYQIYGERFPHWVVVTGFDDHFVYVHDPLVDYEAGETPVDSINMPILRRQFERMARYGKAGVKAMLFVYRRDAQGKKRTRRGGAPSS
jgi:ribosomal protein S18 acetylase RimI-like enzyme